MPVASAIKALIVDDQFTSRALIRGGLQQLGVVDIEMAADGEQGFKIMMEKPAHLVISDFNMPKMDGIGFLRAVRSYPPTKKAAFILLTGRGDRDIIARRQNPASTITRQAIHDALLKSADRGCRGTLE